jgi:hypothetical protein
VALATRKKLCPRLHWTKTLRRPVGIGNQKVCITPGRSWASSQDSKPIYGAGLRYVLDRKRYHSQMLQAALGRIRCIHAINKLINKSSGIVSVPFHIQLQPSQASGQAIPCAGTAQWHRAVTSSRDKWLQPPYRWQPVAPSPPTAVKPAVCIRYVGFRARDAGGHHACAYQAVAFT